tara:strand:+ start:51 stop:1004 length:954 start_codon:yes stop_codon:yes gene_type:complete
MNRQKHISLVIPVYNEQDSISSLIKEILNQAIECNIKEIIFINDGSNDLTKQKILEAKSNNSIIKLLDFKLNRGKSEALSKGFSCASGDYIITIDGDLQDDPSEIKKFISKLNDGWDLVCGWKKTRNDPISKTLPSRIYNFFVRLVTGIKLHDFNCGFKGYKSKVAKSIFLYGGLHRFIPAILGHRGYSVCEVEVNHRSRKFGVSKYGLSRIFHGFFDFITILFLNKFTKRPMHFFGAIGLIFFLTGMGICVYLTINWMNGEWIGERPLFVLGVLLIIVGIQTFSLGLLGELFVNKLNLEIDSSINRSDFDDEKEKS